MGPQEGVLLLDRQQYTTPLTTKALEMPSQAGEPLQAELV
jgi:hypothetical protein